MKHKLIPHNGEIIVVDTEAEIKIVSEVWLAELNDTEIVSEFDIDLAQYSRLPVVISRGVTNPLSDLLRLQREKEARELYPKKCDASNNCDCSWCMEMKLSRRVFLAALDRSPFTAEDMVGFAEFRGTYIKMHGGWMHRYANQHDLSNLITTEKLLEIYLTETAFSRVKESEVEIEMIEINKFTAPSFGYLQTELVWQPRLTDGKVTVTKIL